MAARPPPTPTRPHGSVLRVSPHALTANQSCSANRVGRVSSLLLSPNLVKPPVLSGLSASIESVTPAALPASLASVLYPSA